MNQESDEWQENLMKKIKKRRKKLRTIRKGFEDEEKTSDGKHSYH